MVSLSSHTTVFPGPVIFSLPFCHIQLKFVVLTFFFGPVLSYAVYCHTLESTSMQYGTLFPHNNVNLGLSSISIKLSPMSEQYHRDPTNG